MNVLAGGSRDGVGVSVGAEGGAEGGAGVEKRLLRAVKGVVKDANIPLEGVDGLSPVKAGEGEGDSGCEGEDRAWTSGTAFVGLGDLAAS